jgi:acyl-CoA thioesterase-1
MARGFESKDVEFQQAEAERKPSRGRDLSPDEREADAKRRTLELALVRANADLAKARSEAHRSMLRQAIAALQDQLGKLAVLVAVVLCAASAACGAHDDRRDVPAAAEAHPRAEAPARRSPGEGGRAKVVILGDSLTAGLGLPAEQSYPTLLQKDIDNAGLHYDIVNAGVSGDTSAGGLSRLDWSLAGEVRVLVVALGGNDGLRGLPAAELRQNLATIIERAQSRGITVVLAGMEAPPNYGRDYIVSFHQVFPALARQYRVAFVPFLLQGVAGDQALNQRDGIHPTAKGAQIVAANVWMVLGPILEQEEKRTIS